MFCISMKIHIYLSMWTQVVRSHVILEANQYQEHIAFESEPIIFLCLLGSVSLICQFSLMLLSSQFSPSLLMNIFGEVLIHLAVWALWIFYILARRKRFSSCLWKNTNFFFFLSEHIKFKCNGVPSSGPVKKCSIFYLIISSDKYCTTMSYWQEFTSM